MKIIDDELYEELVILLSKRNKTLLNRLEESKDYVSSIDRARTIKTNRIKERIRASIKKLSKNSYKNTPPTKYEIHNDTKIAYITLGKYYYDIIEEI